MFLFIFNVMLISATKGHSQVSDIKLFVKKYKYVNTKILLRIRF